MGGLPRQLGGVSQSWEGVRAKKKNVFPFCVQE